MPRYQLAAAQKQAAAANLKTLTPAMSPRVEGDSIHMATDIASGVDPARRLQSRSKWNLDMWQLSGSIGNWVSNWHNVSAPAKENTHRSYDQRARDCKKQGLERQRKDEELRSFIATCMKG